MLIRKTSYSPSAIFECLVLEKARRVALRCRTWRGYLATLEAALASGGRF